ncbi:hypothetical protein P2H44_05795 [Albimonas sp. CAU 1670]|uniref:hypothetical protein n=1 Tax=Albimonas sp. CAU 1670 TaxID=3032599 RepID=UPI0023DA7313|nr:hypothetical protein [Albimonas sp. CAU 1670]MDF2232060.1 hypothetical protein [Albimonas sp. CAU 1670]
MPLPVALAPLTGPWALKAAAGAATAFAVWQTARRARWSDARPAVAEAALDQAPEGVEWGWSRDAGRARADARAGLRGALRWGEDGPGVAVDLSALARLRLGLLKPRAKPFRKTAR